MYFSSHDSNISATQLDLAALPVTPTPHESAGMDADGYTTLDRTSVIPYQVQQYVGIAKQLETAQVLTPISEVKHKNPEYITQEHAHASVIKMAFEVYWPRGHKGCIMRSAGIYTVPLQSVLAGIYHGPLQHVVRPPVQVSIYPVPFRACWPAYIMGLCSVSAEHAAQVIYLVPF